MSRRSGMRRHVVVVVLAALGAVAFLYPLAPPRTALAQTPTPNDDAVERTRALDALFAALKSAKQDAEAEPMVEKIWELWSHSGRQKADLLLEQGVGYLALRQYGPAHDRFTEAIEAAPDFAEAWNKRATVLFLLNEHEQSLSDIEMVLTLEPRHFGALAGRGMIHAQAGRWKEALDAYNQALRFNPFLKERAQIIPELERRAGEKPL
jgi:tetratricopeptide (TPR) repeat protein